MRRMQVAAVDNVGGVRKGEYMRCEWVLRAAQRDKVTETL
jgi:hypothetical protein